MATVMAEFDGRVFVPCEPVQLPAGTKVEVFLPSTPGPLTPEEMRDWQAIRRELDASEAPFGTVDEYLRYARKRP